MSREKSNSRVHEKEKDKMEVKLSDMEGEVERLREVNTQLESEINQWKIKCELNDHHNSSEDDLENKNLHYIEEIETLRQLVHEKEDELEMWKNEIRKMEEELNAIYNEADNRMSEEQEVKLKQYEDTLKTMAEENDQLRNANGEMMAKMEAVDELLIENDNLKAILKQLKAKLEVQLETTRTVSKRAQRELELKRKIEEDIRSKVDELKRTSDTTVEYACRSYSEEVSVLKSQGDRQGTEIHELKQQVGELSRELDLVREENKELTDEFQAQEA